MTEYVIRGNAAVLKCSIPSFVADFVKVESWVDEDGLVLVSTENYGYFLHGVFYGIDPILPFSCGIFFS